MTDEMLALAQAERRARPGLANVDFLKGVIEEIPLPAESVDVVISNCVINLSTDKPAVLTEIARVLQPGGRIGISDVVAEDELSLADRAERGSYVGCIAGRPLERRVRGRSRRRRLRPDQRRVHARGRGRDARRDREGLQDPPARAEGTPRRPGRSLGRLLLTPPRMDSAQTEGW